MPEQNAHLPNVVTIMDEDLPLREVIMYSNSNQQVWHFSVADGTSHFADNGITYFEEHAAEKAATIGRKLIAMKNARIDGSRVSGWMISGTVILEVSVASAQ